MPEITILRKVDLSKNLKQTALLLVKKEILNLKEICLMVVIPSDDFGKVSLAAQGNFDFDKAIENEIFFKDVTINVNGRKTWEKDFETILKRFVRDSLVDLAKTLESI